MVPMMIHRMMNCTLCHNLFPIILSVYWNGDPFVANMYVESGIAMMANREK